MIAVTREGYNHYDFLHDYLVGFSRDLTASSSTLSELSVFSLGKRGSPRHEKHSNIIGCGISKPKSSPTHNYTSAGVLYAPKPCLAPASATLPLHSTRIPSPAHRTPPLSRNLHFKSMANRWLPLVIVADEDTGNLTMAREGSDRKKRRWDLVCTCFLFCIALPSVVVHGTVHSQCLYVWCSTPFGRSAQRGALALHLCSALHYLRSQPFSSML
jgi:hypothetical protein